MLSYRHAFHAGNHADVLKHLVLIQCLDYLTRKESPLRYIDTHAGAGMYSLTAPQAQKTGEAATGIGRLQAKPGSHPLVKRYLGLIKQSNETSTGNLYPGSPWIAQQCLREQDKLVLTELHSKDHEALETLFSRQRAVKVAQQNGLERLVSELPSPERRAFVLIDPSYEVKADYEAVATAVKLAMKRMSTAVIAVWFPVVQRERVRKLERQLTGLAEMQVFELGLAPDSREYGMTASGLMVLNPPWGLDTVLEEVMPDLMAALQIPQDGFFRIRRHPVKGTPGKGAASRG
jgi:23S rRNA (adenine2030-N6)-methyltransferase